MSLAVRATAAPSATAPAEVAGQLSVWHSIRRLHGEYTRGLASTVRLRLLEHCGKSVNMLQPSTAVHGGAAAGRIGMGAWVTRRCTVEWMSIGAPTHCSMETRREEPTSHWNSALMSPSSHRAGRCQIGGGPGGGIGGGGGGGGVGGGGGHGLIGGGTLALVAA
jgi:hypothetical protein